MLSNSGRKVRRLMIFNYASDHIYRKVDLWE
jgi:hypothetical protein